MLIFHVIILGSGQTGHLQERVFVQAQTMLINQEWASTNVVSDWRWIRGSRNIFWSNQGWAKGRSYSVKEVTSGRK